MVRLRIRQSCASASGAMTVPSMTLRTAAVSGSSRRLVTIWAIVGGVMPMRPRYTSSASHPLPRSSATISAWTISVPGGAVTAPVATAVQEGASSVLWPPNTVVPVSVSTTVISPK